MADDPDDEDAPDAPDGPDDASTLSAGEVDRSPRMDRGTLEVDSHVEVNLRPKTIESPDLHRPAVFDGRLDVPATGSFARAETTRRMDEAFGHRVDGTPVDLPLDPPGTPMTPESVANFETFPPVEPEPQFVSQLDGKPIDTSDLKSAGPLGPTNLPPAPMSMDTVANFQTYLSADEGERMAREQEQRQREIEEAENSTIAHGGGGGIPRAGLFAAGGAVVLLGLALVAMRGRGSGTPAATPAGGGTVVAAAPAKGAAAWPGCSAAPVPASAAEAIPRDKRWMVAAYCFGGHYYPTEQFQWSSAPGCTEPGVAGNASHLVTKNGAPAQAIDDPGAALPDPRPGGCGFLAMHEAKEQEQAIQGKFPGASNNMFPAHTDAYRAFQGRVGAGR